MIRRGNKRFAVKEGGNAENFQIEGKGGARYSDSKRFANP